MQKIEESVPVFRHDKRPAWGLALLVWERGEKRGYLFEDGALRVIARPYFHHMQENEVEQASLSAVFRQQISQMSLAKANGMVDSRREAPQFFTLDEQAQLLIGQFEGGFSGNTWREQRRGYGSSKALKRHRDPSIAKARKVLGAQRVAGAVAEHQHEVLWQDICDLLQSTDLVPARELKVFRQKLPNVTRTLTMALAALLHADPSGETPASFERRFSSFISELQMVLGASPSWPFVTSLLALHAPADHLCVHPTSLRQQSKWMAVSASSTRRPNATDYQKSRVLAKRLFGQLHEFGLHPVDLLDVYDFMRLSTSPSARKRLAALRQTDLRNVGPQQSDTQDAAARASSQADHGGDGDDRAASEQEAA